MTKSYLKTKCHDTFEMSYDSY